VTRTIGMRGLQEYVGVEDGRPGAPEVRLPFAWWPRARGWFPQPYFDPWLAEDAFDAYAPVREPWAERCPWCHSTYPFEQRIARDAGHGLERHFLSSASGGDRLDTARQVTVGISCESCHLGGRGHAAGGPIHLVPIGAAARPGAPVPSTFAVERRDPAIVNATCAQCHSGPSPRFPDGSATRNSSEALDLARSACAARIRCVDCHDPHRADARADGERAVAACVRCHPATRPAHAGAGHAAASCLDCHMPRTVMGIDGFVRTHRISAPGDARMLGAGAPNACNLCHLDRTTRWTLAELGVTLRAPRIDLDAPTGELWLASPEPAVRMVAADAHARRRTPLAPLLRGLDDDLAHVRVWTRFAVEDLLGHPIDFDPRAPREQRRAGIARLRGD
jgi:hypothetical protein